MGCCSSKSKDNSNALPTSGTSIEAGGVEYEDVFAGIDLDIDDGPAVPCNTPNAIATPFNMINADEDDFSDVDETATSFNLSLLSSSKARVAEIRTLNIEIQKHGPNLHLVEKRTLVQELAQIFHAKMKQAHTAFSRNHLDSKSYNDVLQELQSTRATFEGFLLKNPDSLALARKEMDASMLRAT